VSAASPEIATNAPLAGVRVVITRPGRQAAIFAQRLALVGGEPIVCPAMVIAPPVDDAAFRDALARLAEYDFALFVSANAAEAVLTRDLAWPASLTAIAVGPTTADALILGGIERVLVPPSRFDSEGVLELPALQDVAGKRLVIFRGEGADGGAGRELMRTTLKKRGAKVDAVICYRRVRPTFDADGLVALWRQGKVDAVIATSAEVLDNFLAMIGEPGRRLLESTPLFVPHPRIAAHAKEKGLTRVVTTEPTDAGILQSLLQHFHEPCTSSQ
jgi:uroporphyrinogen-III synthase